MDIFRFTLASVEDDAGDQQFLAGKGVPGEEFRKIVHAQGHGFASSPLPGAHGIGLAMLGRRDRVTAFNLESPDKRPRSTVAGGAALYDAQGNIVYAKMGGGLQVKAVQGGVIIETPLASIAIDGGSGAITAQRGGMLWRMTETRIDLGGLGGSGVLTQSGPSSKVFAVV